MARVHDLGPSFRVTVTEAEVRRWKEDTGARLPATRAHYVTFDKRTGDVLDSSFGEAIEGSIHGGWFIKEVRAFGRALLARVARRAARRNPEYVWGRFVSRRARRRR